VLVVDASVIAPVVADGGADGTRYRKRLRSEQLAGPDLLRIEVLSVIRRQLRIGTLGAAQASHAVDDLLDLPLVVYPTASLLRSVWAFRDDLTSYDGCYVALAVALGCTLLTADGRLTRSPGVTCQLEVI
jgi:predicted nucleic acid-binding protein